MIFISGERRGKTFSIMNTYEYMEAYEGENQ